jgi:mRNA interferase RelE/StbE
MYMVIFDPEASDFLAGLGQDLKKRIFDKVISTKEDPFHYFEHLVGRADYKLRVGDYRVIADISRENKTIEVTLIGHRKNVYKKL